MDGAKEERERQREYWRTEWENVLQKLPDISLELSKMRRVTSCDKCNAMQLLFTYFLCRKSIFFLSNPDYLYPFHDILDALLVFFSWFLFTSSFTGSLCMHQNFPMYLSDWIGFSTVSLCSTIERSNVSNKCRKTEEKNSMRREIVFSYQIELCMCMGIGM